MTLTTDDLQAIKGIVDDAVEISMQQTASGFAEVHEKFAEVHEQFAEVHERFVGVQGQFDGVHEELSGLKADLESVKSTVGRIELVQRVEVSRADRHDQEIAFLRQKIAKA